ncbi:hypothetical protein [Facilibium subflavum]|uniref:hypothetical protein n=1 Tax=Facilibium subflavum TaxID=2219058 RepID=UPI000E6540BC|nr:hypothetical protein [Facilibium subflavum]
MKKFPMKLTALCTLSLLTSGLYAADCHVKDIKDAQSYTPTLDFQCDQAVDLAHNEIRFDLSAGGINGAWNFVADGQSLGLDVAIDQAENHITLKLNPWNTAAKVKAGQTVSFQYSPTDAAQISNFRVGDETPVKQGSISFSTSKGSQAIPDDAVILLEDEQGQIAYQLQWQQVAKQSFSVAPGTYTVVAYIAGQDKHIPIQVVSDNPVTVTENKTSKVTLDYKQQQQAQLQLSLNYVKPTDVESDKITITMQNINQVNDVQSIDLGWGKSVDIQLQQNQTYKLSVSTISGRQNIYEFAFLPDSTITTDSSTMNYQRKLQMHQTPIQTYEVSANISGLPKVKSTTLTILQDGKVIKTQTIQNGETSIDLQAGSYQAKATTVIDGKYQYQLSPVLFNVKKDMINTLALSFNKQKFSNQVRGWPNYIAMGAVTDANVANTNQLEDRNIDSVFKYAGDGGNGDPGKIVYPIYTQNTYNFADKLSKLNGHKTRPVMVVYTAEMSGGTSFKDFDNEKSDSALENRVLTKHFVNLMLLAQTMQTEHDKDDLDGSVVLNPDLMGMVQQQKLDKQLLDENPKYIDVENAIQQAYWFMTTAHDWHLVLSNGKKLDIEQKTPEQFIQLVESGALKAQGVYSPWDIKTPWQDAAMDILNQYKDTHADLPSFENNFKGWVQATNWVMKKFAPSISFGWQENVWNIGSATWVHNDLTESEVAQKVSNPTIALWKKAEVYSGQYKPDFFVFDKYERNPIPGEVGAGFAWNARDWGNYLTYVKQLSEGLGDLPVMLWQIPGGHLQTTQEHTQVTHGATGPDYFLGNPDVDKNLSNLQAYIKDINLADGTYHCQSDEDCQLPNYLLHDKGNTDHNWQIGNMDKAQESHVFAILWGGGSTTSVGTFPMSDDGWLATQVNNYESQYD